jgi:hypothetical protein
LRGILDALDNHLAGPFNTLSTPPYDNRIIPLSTFGDINHTSRLIPHSANPCTALADDQMMMFRRDAQVPRTIPLIAERGDELFEMVLCLCEVGFVSAAEFPWDCIVVCLWGLFFDVPRVRFVSVVVVDAA